MATAELRDVNGATVRQVFNQHYSYGLHTIPCDLEGLPAGTYFLTVINAGRTRVEKVVKTKN